MGTPLIILRLVLSLVRSGGILGVVLRDDLRPAPRSIWCHVFHAEVVGQETIGTFDGVPYRRVSPGIASPMPEPMGRRMPSRTRRPASLDRRRRHAVQ